ncbi:hypothetical protein GCM10009416_18050 [Craurococcus roseus]|uniref:Uncharacterized protein n=1 Tax=Craurococcus roseus TaxID=77585 RepID=A0ABN1F1K4_9PROT
MAWTLDARLPVVIVADTAALAGALAAGSKAAVLAEAPPPPMPEGAAALASFDPVVPHAAGCACCGGRPPAAAALDRLFQARVRGACPWFERVIALVGTLAAREAVAAALSGDAVTAARFRAG